MGGKWLGLGWGREVNKRNMRRHKGSTKDEPRIPNPWKCGAALPAGFLPRRKIRAQNSAILAAAHYALFNGDR